MAPEPHRVMHRRGFRSECLVASDPEGPDTLNVMIKMPDAAQSSPVLKSEEPRCLSCLPQRHDHPDKPACWAVQSGRQKRRGPAGPDHPTPSSPSSTVRRSSSARKVR
jgi:hypothetical protein